MASHQRGHWMSRKRGVNGKNQRAAVVPQFQVTTLKCSICKAVWKICSREVWCHMIWLWGIFTSFSFKKITTICRQVATTTDAFVARTSNFFQSVVGAGSLWKIWGLRCKKINEPILLPIRTKKKWEECWKWKKSPIEKLFKCQMLLWSSPQSNMSHLVISDVLHLSVSTFMPNDTFAYQI